MEWMDDHSVVVVGGRRNTYNVGQVITVDYAGTRTYVTLGVPTNDGRNSYFQQIGPAFRRFIEDPSDQKRMTFFALSKDDTWRGFGRVYTWYHHFMYRVLNTVGISGNWLHFLESEPPRFGGIQDLVNRRNEGSSSQNNSSYVYFDDERGKCLLFLKTYGASKYESFFLALASMNLETDVDIELRSLVEGELTALPDWCISYIEESSDGRVQCLEMSKSMDEHREPVIAFPPSLRSPRHRANVRLRCGPELCAMCEEEDQSEIEAAHVLDVHILRLRAIEDDPNEELWSHSTSGDNGFWLCKFHHRAFDTHRIAVKEDGRLLYNKGFSEREIRGHRESITRFRLEGSVLSEGFRLYLGKRNSGLDMNQYEPF